MWFNRDFGAYFFLVYLAIMLPRYELTKQDRIVPPYEVFHSGQALGTKWHVKFDLGYRIVPNSKFSSEYFSYPPYSVIHPTLSHVDHDMSTWRNDSYLMQFNLGNSTDWEPVPQALATVIQEAKRVYDLTDGAFDVTAGTLVLYWGFGPNSVNLRSRDTKTLDDYRRMVGSNMLHVRTDPPEIRKDNVNLFVDLSAIAKGYAVDQIALGLHEKPDCYQGMVEIGGELRVWGYKHWPIMIEAPVSGRREPLTVVELKNQAMATSGDYRQHKTVDGREVTHIIDPRTGMPIEHDLASVSVVHESCMTADALATALMVMGPGEGYDFCVKQDIAALLVTRESDAFAVKRTPAWKRDVKERGALPRR